MFIERLIGFHYILVPSLLEISHIWAEPIIWILAIISVASVREVLNLPAV